MRLLRSVHLTVLRAPFEGENALIALPSGDPMVPIGDVVAIERGYADPLDALASCDGTPQ